MDDRRERLVRVVRAMFDTRVPNDENRGLDEMGVPLRLRRLGERFFTEDCRFHVPGRGPQSFSEVGREAYFRATAKRMRATEGRQDLQLLDVMVGEEGAAALIRYSDESGGRRFEWLRVNAYRFDASGERIAEVRVFEHDQHGLDAFMGAAYAGVAGE